ncbi:hypothetical protein L227DRAFT_576102 [Lentinus tigrinus ALCF2SS1-6]|uniref:Uncharacterized protein n=1 Tax=Lentinus tigrinus ALCF2SS1-6 TaxID=1328759 RepID=A0A5C2S8T4_9APHY|nr:hypothetical protein L227DRAFT_576102 [Lentinus tigrinus ALCF2SS1-6]
MPVTFDVALHKPREYCRYDDPPVGVQGLLKAAYERSLLPWIRYKLRQSSVKESDVAKLEPRSNGFVHAVLDAYACHHHLRIRPDDVWLAILTQLSFYVNAHAEELRQYFVAHEGQRSISVEVCSGELDYASMTRQFVRLIHEMVVDSTFVEWILPDFTTTTEHDRTIGSIALMSTLKSYATYSIDITCGIPTVTLDGEKSDWEEIHRRLSRLSELGDEPAVWADMLRPIIRRFVSAFDGEPDVEFWSRVAHWDECCGQDDWSGWITAFCVWSSQGKWLPPTPAAESISRNMSQDATEGSVRARVRDANTSDGVEYFTIDGQDIPPGYSEVDVTVDDRNCIMIAGHVAYALSAKVPGGQLNTLCPAAHWFLVETREEADAGQEEEVELRCIDADGYWV